MKNNNKSRPKLILAGVLVVFLMLPVAPRVKMLWDLNQRIERLENQKLYWSNTGMNWNRS